MAAEAARYVVVVDEPKLCARVGGAHPVPVEILPVFAQRTLRQIAALPARAQAPMMPRTRAAQGSTTEQADVMDTRPAKMPLHISATS